MHNKIQAEEVEKQVQDKIRAFGFETSCWGLNEFYDFKIGNKVCEVKSCTLFISNGSFKADFKKKSKDFGMFDFHPTGQLAKLKEVDALVFFVISYRGQFLFLGFLKALDLPDQRRVSLKNILKLNLLEFEKDLLLNLAEETRLEKVIEV